MTGMVEPQSLIDESAAAGAQVVHMHGKKIFGSQGLQELRAKYKGKKIGLCHGAFDAIHIGHIEHLEEAKSLCDVLVVSITDDNYIQKHPRGTYHSAFQRAELMASLLMVDYVYVDGNKESVEVLSNLRPDCYFKGSDYNKQIEVNAALKREVTACEANGGKVVFTRARKHSSSYLLNNFLDEKRILIGEYLRKYAISADGDYIDGIYNALATAEILILGESILDVYIYGTLTGLSSKYTATSFLQSSTKVMAGGTLVIIPLLSDYVKKVTALVPEDYTKMGLYKTRPNVVLKEESFSVVEKTRFISSKKKERLFETVRFSQVKEFCLADKIGALVRDTKHSAVLIYDYGHGFFYNANFMQPDSDHFYAVNVQANSTNYPFNDVSKYKHFNLVTMDERELRLTLRDNKSNFEDLMQHFLDTSPMAGKAYFFFTQGERGAWCCHKGQKVYCPALVDNVVDATGSGDVFHAVATIFIVSGIDIGTALFFASLYAGLYAQVEGHDGSVSKDQIIRAIRSMQ
jgi:cytidyltransferase-like protein